MDSGYGFIVGGYIKENSPTRGKPLAGLKFALFGFMNLDCLHLILWFHLESEKETFRHLSFRMPYNKEYANIRPLSHKNFMIWGLIFLFLAK